jgi:signal transduction histidine kinase
VVQSQSFHLAEHVPEKMLALNQTLRGLGIPPDPAVLADFQKQAAEMKLWLRTNSLSVTSAPQRDSLNRIEAALDLYVMRTTRIVEENMRAGSSAKQKSISEQMEQESSPIPGLARELHAAEQAALDRFVKESRRSMANLFLQVLLSVGMALVLGLAAFRLIHVARIAPLKAKLVQSHSILEHQEKLASLGTLAAGVAHEVRNPLTAIKVRLHSLKRATPNNPSATDDLSVINHEIKRLERIVGDLLQFARPSAPELQTFLATTLFEQLKGLLGSQLEAADIGWHIEAPPEINLRAAPNNSSRS